MPRPPRIEPSGDVVARVASTALALPDAYEEDAWTGVRWRVRNRTFAHVLVAQEGYTSAYRDLTGIAAPTTVLTFRSSGDELLALTHAGPPLPAAMVAHRRRHGARWRHRLGRGGRACNRELPVLRTPEVEAPAGSIASWGHPGVSTSPRNARSRGDLGRAAPEANVTPTAVSDRRHPQQCVGPRYADSGPPPLCRAVSGRWDVRALAPEGRSPLSVQAPRGPPWRQR